MAANTSDIITLAEVKTYLGLSDATEHDAMLERQIQAASEFVSEYIGRYLLNVAITERIGIKILTAPVFTTHIDIVKDSISLHTWSDQSNLTTEPDTEITVIGRLDEQDLGTHVYPKGKWPHYGNYLLRMTVGMKADKIPAAIKEAVVLGVRQLYDGYRTITNADAIFILLGPFRRPM